MDQLALELQFIMVEWTINVSKETANPNFVPGKEQLFKYLRNKRERKAIDSGL